MRVRVRAFYVLLYFKLPSPQPSPKGRGEDVLVVLANLTAQKRPVYTVLRYRTFNRTFRYVHCRDSRCLTAFRQRFFAR